AVMLVWCHTCLFLSCKLPPPPAEPGASAAAVAAGLLATTAAPMIGLIVARALGAIVAGALGVVEVVNYLGAATRIYGAGQLPGLAQPRRLPALQAQRIDCADARSLFPH